MTTIMAVEGVLRTDTKDPIPEGLKLFRTLVVSYRVILSTKSDRKEIEHWLKSNFIVDFANVFTSEDVHAAEPLRKRHINLAQQGGKMEMYIDSDPEDCAMALSMSVPSILFTTPKYFKSDRKIRPWDAITEEQERQKHIIVDKYSDFINGSGSRWE